MHEVIFGETNGECVVGVRVSWVENPSVFFGSRSVGTRLDSSQLDSNIHPQNVLILSSLGSNF